MRVHMRAEEGLELRCSDCGAEAEEMEQGHR